MPENKSAIGIIRFLAQCLQPVLDLSLDHYHLDKAEIAWSRGITEYFQAMVKHLFCFFLGLVFLRSRAS